MKVAPDIGRRGQVLAAGESEDKAVGEIDQELAAGGEVLREAEVVRRRERVAPPCRWSPNWLKTVLLVPNQCRSNSKRSSVRVRATP